MDVRITLKEGADYFLIRADLENRGKYYVTSLYAGPGEFVAAESRDQETLAIATCVGGTVWSNPFESFKERETFGYSIFGSDVILEAGWMDLYGPKGGIGTGYINRQGLTMFFNARKGQTGMNLNWQLFNLYHEGAVESWGAAGGIYPLKPGEKFSTDAWLLAPHEGDWHRMADIYRAEYEEAFKGDYLDWESTHEIARRTDVTTGLNIYDARTGRPPMIQFDELPGRVRTFLSDTGVDPANLVVVMVAHGSHAGLHMPDFIPSAAEAGGDGAFKAAVADIKRMGVDGVLFYGHAYYNHPKASDYVAEGDTGYDLSNKAYGDIGNVACVDCKAWLDLWRKKYIPGYHALGAAGVYWDQGGTQSVVCTNSAHSHGGSAAGILGGHINGVNKLLKAFRDGFQDRRPFFMCESGQDAEMRHTDLWDCQCKIAQYVKGGQSRHEIIRYTFPYRAMVEAVRNADDINDALINGFAIQGIVKPKSDEYAEALRQYFRLRKELRQTGAPGFPYGFRDRVGLSVSTDDLVARSYVGDSGITVVYCARVPVKATIALDPSKLGMPGSSPQTIEVDLKKGEAGFQTIRF